MPNRATQPGPLEVADFTKAVESIIQLLEDKYPPHQAPAENSELIDNPRPWRRSGLSISDVVDNNGSQYVDLVQEGGGIHGIALAGYTYVLEKMGVSFSKMAGTSAGSINTMILSAVTTRDELRWLQEKTPPQKKGAKAWESDLQYKPELLNVNDYFETRSEKMLFYLAGKNLSDLVDGHAHWRRIILSTFRGQVKFDNIKAYFRQVKRWFLITVISFVLLFLAGFVLALFNSETARLISQWIYRISGLAFIAGIIYLVVQVLQGKHLYDNAESFGINPGTNFEKWIQDILEENGIMNVSQLKNKLQLEQQCLKFSYVPVPGENKYFENVTTPVPYKEEADKLRSEFIKIKSEFSEDLVLARQGNKSKRKLADDLNDKLEELTWRIVKLAKKIDPDLQGKEDLANALVHILIEMNKLRAAAFQDDVDDFNISPAYKKEIAIVSSDISNEMKAEFPAMHKLYWGENYDISPAKYVRASMAIPGFFKPFRIDYALSQKAIMEKEWNELLNIGLRLEEKDKCALLVDGGLLSNFPVNIFFNPDSPLPNIPTVGVKLEFENESSQNTIESNKEMLGAMVSTMRYFYDRDFISKHNIFKKTVRSIDTGKVHWLNFDLTDREKIELFFRGALTAAIFLLGKEDENCRASAAQDLIQMGKKVSFRGSFFAIYENLDVPEFLTEDNPGDVSFNWERYKMERILLLGEQNAMRGRIKRKAGYVDTPPTRPNPTAD